MTDEYLVAVRLCEHGWTAPHALSYREIERLGLDEMGDPGCDGGSSRIIEIGPHNVELADDLEFDYVAATEEADRLLGRFTAHYADVVAIVDAAVSPIEPTVRMVEVAALADALDIPAEDACRGLFAMRSETARRRPS